MNSLFPLVFCFVILLCSVIKGYFVAYPLLLSLVILLVTFYYQGFAVKSLIKMGFTSSQKAFPIIKILLLIGAVTAVWMAAGTIPALVYYGTQFINPRYFILSAFVLSCFISVLLGTSFGTVSTVGVALMIMAKEGDINPHLVAGAIIAGAYFGDRCSPMSSSAHLVASITKTKLHRNLRAMISTAWLPLMASSLIYLIFSISNPVEIRNSDFISEIPKLFNINPLVLLPAFTVIVLCLFKVEVKLTLLASLGIGFFVGIFSQGYSLLKMINFAWLGFNLEQRMDLSEVLTGGGIFSMLRVSLVVILSTSLSGIIVGTKTFASVENILKRASSRSRLFFGTTTVGLASAAFGCTQTLAILLTHQLVKEKYEQERLDNYQLATDIENTAVVLSPLIPWNIAGLVPATLLMTDSGFIPYAVYLYLIPVWNWVRFKLTESKMQDEFE
ncbi:Na+/H+ antiporter NhaC family protein [Brasilonema bromeliae]|uniref:Na+/H+ antiporter NhaC family protein n=1 Tax=Brasilonema bromeliae SPC951 TaxID=385972 RepID=A0ABX1P8G3_9CYAN|nr:Na+/H+ antiporter NhaC family protein [Brasilonema bromeliae]NMG20631.1 Na+/H+ antiporter NhaC family protein [Brasilonema bromeliae SPC951]